MYTYFTPTPEALEEAKSLYRKLARQYHPDFGGSEETMKALNAEYASFQANFSHSAQRKRQAEAHKEGRKTNADFIDLNQVMDELREKVESLLAISTSLEVELCGLWIWVTGDTKPHKDKIKVVPGMRWAREKEAWYFAAVKSHNREKRTMDEIREMHGSTRVSRQRDEQRAALPA
jgi:ribosomal protein L35